MKTILSLLLAVALTPLASAQSIEQRDLIAFKPMVSLEPDYKFVSYQAPTPPAKGSIVSLSGFVSPKIGSNAAVAGALTDINAYTFTGVPLFRTLDLHLDAGILATKGLAVAGGGLGRSFKLADQADMFFALGLLSIQSQTGLRPMASGGITIRF